MGFRARVYAVVRQVPEGRVVTYGDVAAAIGSPRAARQVGWALAALSDPTVPWQRVINAQGRISGRGEVGRAVLQEQLLVQEGVGFDDSGRCDLKALRYPLQPPELYGDDAF